VTAHAVTIPDNYYGADPTHSNWDDKDVIGDVHLFDISQMQVTFQGDQMLVDIHTRYLDNIGAYDTQLGDLFISTNGWNPAGTAPYVEDNFGNPGAEKWEYALVMDSHSPSGTSGTTSLYHVSNDPLLSRAPNGYVYRAGQEVQYAGGDSTPFSGTWSMHKLDTSDDRDDFLRFVIGLDAFAGISDFGFHWTMSCANDVIEGGAAPVPEPATMLLFGTGLVGLAVSGRRKFRRSQV
jgi:hypothetical protein